MRVAACLLILFRLSADSGESYYKFPKGSTWTYAMTGFEEGEKKAKMVLTVTGEEDGKVAVEMKEKAEGGKATQVFWYVADGALTWAEKKDGAIKDAIGLYKLGAKKGDTWAGEGKGIQKHSGTFVGAEEVKVPTGTYKEALHSRIEMVEGGGTVKLDVYLVEKVGVVKMAYTFGEKQMALELEEFKPAK